MRYLFFFGLNTNHLGNVRAVVSDRRGFTTIAGTTGNYTITNDPELMSWTDYYPFGMRMEGRYGSTDSYRFGFQGQEMDDEIKGDGNSVNYKYRMHDPRIGRFFAVDPLTSKYPHYTPYSFSGNEVIHMVELEGLEPGYTSDKNMEPVEAEHATTGEDKWWYPSDDGQWTNGPSPFPVGIVEPPGQGPHRENFYNDAVNNQNKKILAGNKQPSFTDYGLTFTEEALVGLGLGGGVASGTIAFSEYEKMIKSGLLTTKFNMTTGTISLIKNGTVVRQISVLQNSSFRALSTTLKATSSLKIVTVSIGVVANSLGIVVTVVEMFGPEGVTAELGADLIMGLVGYAGPVGAGASAFYFTVVREPIHDGIEKIKDGAVSFDNFGVVTH